MIEQYTAIFPFKPKNWVIFHQPSTLEEAISLMEACASFEAGLYQISRHGKRRGTSSMGVSSHQRITGVKTVWDIQGANPSPCYPDGGAPEDMGSSLSLHHMWAARSLPMRLPPHGLFPDKDALGHAGWTRLDAKVFIPTVELKGKPTWVLVDRECRRILVNKASRKWTQEVL